jgi:hypothetical protein
MGKLVHDGNTKVHFLPSVANVAAPTAAEITAGDDITGAIPSDGVNVTNTRNNASVSMLDSAFTPEQVGTWGAGITLKFTRDPDGASDPAGDVAFALFAERGPGFLVISRFGDPVAGSIVEVYPVENHKPSPLATAENEYQMFEVQLAVTDEPNYLAEVAA